MDIYILFPLVGSILTNMSLGYVAEHGSLRILIGVLIPVLFTFIGLYLRYQKLCKEPKTGKALTKAIIIVGSKSLIAWTLFNIIKTLLSKYKHSNIAYNAASYIENINSMGKGMNITFSSLTEIIGYLAMYPIINSTTDITNLCSSKFTGFNIFATVLFTIIIVASKTKFFVFDYLPTGILDIIPFLGHEKPISYGLVDKVY
jgi:hypothetical protein